MKKTFLTLSLAVMTVLAVAQVSFGDARLFNDGWLFALQDDSLALQPRYDDSKWRKLDLPHDWSIEGTASPTLASCTGYLPAGIGWYRKHFSASCADGLWTVSGRDAAEQLSVYFEGIYNRSSVYLNGHLLGYRPSGFASFLYELTPYLVDGDNVISVRVDHSRIADSRWYTGSGIYRNAWLVSSPRVHLAQWGTDYQLLSRSGKTAVVQVNASVDNAAEATGNLQIRVSFVDAAGNVVATRKANVNAKSPKAQMRLSIQNAWFWNLDDPYLYTLRTELLMGGKVIDSNEIHAGLRELDFDPDHGFAINGRATKMKGVCLHHDAGALGAAVPDQVWERRLLRLKMIGVNAIRCSHNPHAPILYDLCDRLGLLVMDEASDEWEFPKRKWIKGWNVGEPGYDGTYDFFEEWIDRDVTDMVRRDRNHPSVVMWSIGNEVDYPNDPYSHPVLDGGNAEINQPMFGGYDPKRPNAERIGKIAKRLAACVRIVDQSRPVTGALAGVVMSNQTEYPEAVDIVGYNYTENRYDVDHKTYPDRVIYGSETGVGYDSWAAVRDKEHIFGQFIWTGTDYLGESGRWPSRGLHTGLLDFGSFPKPRGLFRAALWLEQPFCYIGTMRKPDPRRMRRSGNNRNWRNWASPESPDLWNYEPGDTIRVSCYTNAPQARLMLNGREVGAMKDYDLANGIIWWDVVYEPGVLSAVACDVDGNEVAAYDIHTSARPYELRVRFDNVVYVTGDIVGVPAIADEADTSISGINHIVVEVYDENGHFVRLADNNITCRIEGAAELLGLDGSDNSDMGNYQDNQQRVFEGRLLAYVRNASTPGKVRISFSSPLLHGTSVTYEVR